MNIKKKNMKGFIFTLDAIFALVVASVGVSILLYVDFANATSYVAGSSQAASVMQSMLQTTMASISGGSLYASYLSASANASTYAWPQFGHDGALSSSTGFSPQAAFLLYTFNTPSSNMLPTVAVNLGLVAFAAGDKVYLINATTGVQKTVFPAGNPSTVVGAPAIYKNMFFYANASNVVRGVSISNTLVQWNYTASNSIISPILIENNYVAFGTANGFYLLNPLNGSKIASVTTGSPMQPPIYVNGEYVASTALSSIQDYVYSYSLLGSTLTQIWNAPVTSTLMTTAPSSTNGTIAVGSGNVLYIFSLGGTQLFKSTDLGSRIVGIGSYGNSYYVQAAQKFYAFSQAGNIIFGYSNFADSQNSTPSAGSGAAYSLVNGNLFEAYNTSLGTRLWNISLPSNYLNTGYSNIALAYGNMYVPNGNVLYVYGTYKPQPNDNILQTISAMYLNGQGGYSGAMLQRLYNATNTGIFINNTYAPSLRVATFNSVIDSYIEQPDGFAWMNNATNKFTISVWVDPTSSNGVIVDELDSVLPNTKWHQSIIELINGNVFMRTSLASCMNLGRIPLNSWSNIAITFNGSIYKGYVNGTLAGSLPGVSRSVPGPGFIMYYPLGDADGSNCGSGAAFSGSMLDYQFYNRTVSSQQIGQIYQSGAFGSPINPTIVMWWPLNGNADDFAGYFNSGLQYGISYIQSAYTPRGLSNAYQVSKSSVPLFLNSNGINRQYNVSVVTWR